MGLVDKGEQGKCCGKRVKCLRLCVRVPCKYLILLFADCCKAKGRLRPFFFLPFWAVSPSFRVEQVFECGKMSVK